MSPNGRRAWRKWMRRVEHDPNLRPQGKSISRLAREGKRHLGSIPPTPAKPFTARSLVGMTMGARKRAAYYEALRSSYDGDGGPISNRKLRLCLRTALLTPEVLSDSVPLDYRLDVRAKYRIGQRLRPCPGCCACWGHRISSAYGEIAECCGPQTSGKRKTQIKAMRKWQETLADNCDGSGVMPARRSK